MGRICRICGNERPNEQFGGRGQRAIVCSKCRRLPKEVRRSILLRGEIAGFLDQSNISKKNIKRLSQLESDQIEEVAELASLVKQISLVRPGRRKRWKRLWFGHRHLVHAANKAGLLDFPPSGDGSIDVGPFDDDAEWSSELDFLEDEFPEDCFGVWIEPRPYEREPRSSHLFRRNAN